MIKMIVVQGSSRSWSGGRDLCMNIVDGKTVLEHTISRMRSSYPELQIYVIAPEFDRGGELDGIVSRMNDGGLGIYYGHDASPLKRMVEVARDFDDRDHIIRVDALNMFVDVKIVNRGAEYLKESDYDCIKFPDDYPIQFTADIYKVGAIRRMASALNFEDAVYEVHPKYYMFANEGFRCRYVEADADYSDSYLSRCRDTARKIYVIPRLEVNDKRVSAGDQLTFHYELAIKLLNDSMDVLDIACGIGYGGRLISRHVRSVVGADIDAETIEKAKALSADYKNLKFVLDDVTGLSFADRSFDAVVSMETIEHVDDQKYLMQIHRVLKPGGILILSTPQNRCGRIPVNAEHRREYSLEEIKTLCSEYFKIEKIIGIKQGRIVIDSDPVGTNTVLVCRK